MTLLTEDEAKDKWCPMARLSEMGGTFNRCGPHAGLYCIASACMAWRTQIVSDWRADRNEQHPETVLGYCGAFGPPDTAVSP